MEESERKTKDRVVRTRREHDRTVNEFLVDDEVIGELIEHREGTEEITCHVDWVSPKRLKRIIEEWRSSD